MANEHGPPRGAGDGDEEPTTAWSIVARHYGYGLTTALAVGLFLGVGWWVDGRLGTTPLLTIVGALVGGAAGFYSMFRHLVLDPRDRRGGRGE